MLSKNKQKLIHSLAQKKQRDAFSCFVAEGPKVVEELMPHFRCQLLCATQEYLLAHSGLQADEVCEVSERELSSVSNQKTPQQVLAVFRKPVQESQAASELQQEASRQLLLALDGVQDPGNLGTIIRLADWFGIRHIICSPDTADAWAPKVVQATMGALARVQLHYTPLAEWLRTLPASTPVYGTHLDGTDLYQEELAPCGVIVMGNEGKGISPAVGALVSQRLRIPSYPPGEPTSESLNVAIATAVVCAEFRRRQTQV